MESDAPENQVQPDVKDEGLQAPKADEQQQMEADEDAQSAEDLSFRVEQVFARISLCNMIPHEIVARTSVDTCSVTRREVPAIVECKQSLFSSSSRLQDAASDAELARETAQNCLVCRQSQDSLSSILKVLQSSTAFVEKYSFKLQERDIVRHKKRATSLPSVSSISSQLSSTLKEGLNLAQKPIKSISNQLDLSPGGLNQDQGSSLSSEAMAEHADALSKSEILGDSTASGSSGSKTALEDEGGIGNAFDDSLNRWLRRAPSSRRSQNSGRRAATLDNW